MLFCHQQEGGEQNMAIRLDHILFPDGCEKALTFSFDDGVEEDKKLIRLFAGHHLRGTFNLNSGCFGEKQCMRDQDRIIHHDVMTAQEAATVYSGQEVAAHGFHHWSMTDCPPDAAIFEVLKDRNELEKMVGRRVTGFAYPYGHYNAAVIEMLRTAGIRYARTVNSTYAFRLPEDPLRWDATCHILDERRDDLLQQFLDAKITLYSPEPKLFYLWGHGYELTATDTWEDWERFLDKCACHEDIWYASNGEIIGYLDAVKRLEYTLDRSVIYNPSAVSVWMRIDGRDIEIQSGEAMKY